VLRDADQVALCGGAAPGDVCVLRLAAAIGAAGGSAHGSAEWHGATMAVQVYVGTLTRFFSHDWETEAQRDARRTGNTVIVTGPDGQPIRPQDPATIEPQILLWRDYVARGVVSIDAALSWPEGMAAPYFTLGMSWDALGALYLWAAYAEKPGVPRPGSVSRWAEDPVFVAQSASHDRSILNSLLCSFWLPSAQVFSMACTHPAEGRAKVASLPVLRRALADLNAKTWRASGPQIGQWRQLYREDTGGLIEPAARYAFSVILTLANVAHRDGLPMTLRF
jgi:hypothetical protein